MSRIPVFKTYKLFIAGDFPRSESGRSLAVHTPDGRVIAHVSHASRKDLRNAVEAARKGFERWSNATPYNRAQVLYRLAEMTEGKRAELIDALTLAQPRMAPSDPEVAGVQPARELDLSIDRIIAFAGWADKFHHVLGCANPVSGPYHNFTIPEPVGVVAVVCPDAPALLSLISLALPALCTGCAVVALAPQPNPIPASIFAEAAATSDLPAGALNILTGVREELIPHIASHRGIDAVHAANLHQRDATALRLGSAENLKRVTVRDADLTADDCESPAWIEPLLDMKTIWHPSAT
jgi:acyl-CoA reductase-like NAD-dependent aldehyde dehydrogenase